MSLPDVAEPSSLAGLILWLSLKLLACRISETRKCLPAAIPPYHSYQRKELLPRGDKGSLLCALMAQPMSFEQNDALAHISMSIPNLLWRGDKSWDNGK